MMNRRTGTICFLAVIVLTTSSIKISAAARHLQLEGMRIFTAAEVLRGSGLGPDKLPLRTDRIITAIKNFYVKNHYDLVRIHVIEDQKDKLLLYIDEGLLARVVVHEKNSYYALKIKQTIRIPGRVYNSEMVEDSIETMRYRFGFVNVRAELEKAGDYSDNLFQIDRELNSLEFSDQKIRLFARYPAEYELHFYFDQEEIERGFGSGREGWGLDIDYNFPSVFIPVFSIYSRGLLMKKDYMETDFSAGFDPGLKGWLQIRPENTIKIPPDISFYRIETEYRFMPIENSIFTPVILGRLYGSNSGRIDLGLEKYEYLTIRGTLAPGISPLADLNIYAGLGCENVNISQVKIDPDSATHADVEKGWENYPFCEARISFDPIPFRLGYRVEKNYSLTFTSYLDGTEFSRTDLKGAHDFEFKNLSIFSLRVSGVWQSSNTPFSMHEPVSGRYFKGFSGRSYYSNRLMAISTEYRFSIYQDYIYTGIFFDWTYFDPEGYKISGKKSGIAGGPTARVLIYDQFEFTLYFGWDRLIPDGESGRNLKMKLTKRF